MTMGVEVKEKVAVRITLIFVAVGLNDKNNASKYSLRVRMCKEPF